MRTLKHGSDCDGELLTALFDVALIKTGAGFRAFLLSDYGGHVLFVGFAMRANRTIGPLDAFQIFAGLVGILKTGVGEVRGGSPLLPIEYRDQSLLCKVPNCPSQSRTK